MAMRTIEITGGGDRSFPGELSTWEDAPRHGVVMLPGQGYTCVMPAFYFLEEMALGHGAAVLSLAPGYSRDERFAAFPLEQQQRDWLRDDVQAGVTALLAAHDVPELSVVAKSLTTLGLADLDWSDIAGGRTVRLVWLTPLLRDAAVMERLTTTDVPSLVVIGTADHHYDPAAIDRLRDHPAVSVELIDGAGHSFGQRGDIDRSLANIGQVVRATRGFAFGSDAAMPGG